MASIHTQFICNGDKLITEVAPSYKLDFLYDENNQLYGFVKDNTAKYFYIRDVLGNILGILDESGTLSAQYFYSAFGQITTGCNTDNIANINPFKYKGYYYDQESSMYYCNARYYVPQWGRWLTPDSADYLQYDSITGFNTFTYCNNNPVMYADPSGHIVFTTAMLIGLIAGAIIGGTVGGAIAYNEAKENGAEGWELAGKTALGILGGGILGGAIGTGIGYIAPAIGSALSSISLSLPSMGGAGAAVMTQSASFVGGYLLLGAGVIGIGSYLFASDNRPRDNRKQNEQYSEAMRRLGYKKKD